MSIKCWEMLDSMSGSVSNDSEQGEVRKVKRRYLIGQTEGFNDTVAQIELYAPSYVNSDGAGLYWVRKELEIAGVGNRYFDCTATYETLQPKKKEDDNNNGGDSVPGSVSWDTTGHTEHKTQSLLQRKYPNNAPGFSGAINVSGNSVNGIDVVSPGMKYSETWILPIQIAMSANYVSAVYSKTGTVNSTKFRAFDPGTCLFLGARGQWQGDQPYVTVTFDFEARPNKKITVPVESQTSPLAGLQIDKKGWEYIWFLYAPSVSSSTLVQFPIAAYVDKIYEEEDWSSLLITGTTPANPLQGAAGAPVGQPGGAPA